MERAVGKNEKVESFKLQSLKFESFAGVGQSQAKLERTERSWKEPIGVGRNRPKLESFFKLESFAEVSKFNLNFPTS